MAKFEIGGITLRIPKKCLGPELEKALVSGRYESSESAALTRHARPGDRLLDLGAGAGYLSALGAQILGGGNVISVEASPDMIEVLGANLKANNAGAATVLHGAVVPDAYAHRTVPFAVRPAFWASSIADRGVRPEIVQNVPALRLSALLQAHQPSLVMMDVEGAEAELCLQPWPGNVRLLIMEIHTKRYPLATVKAMFDGLSRSGMAYMPWGSRGEVLVFQRVGTED